MKKVILSSLLAIMAMPAWGSLSTFQTYVGTYGVSTDGFGSLGTSGTISANVPAGATVVAAYLYTAYYDGGSGSGSTLAGSAVSYGGFVGNGTACCTLGSRRADVTSIVSPIINGGVGGVYDFTVTEANSSLQDGEALVVVYSLGSLATSTIGILDGFASVTGDTATMTFGAGLDPTAPGFLAEMYLGINFSCCSQQSTVAVNGTTITAVAGNFDDGDELSNGALFTMGGFNDPYSTHLPDYANDHERYNLIPYIDLGDTQIVVDTANASQNDNIFLAVFAVTGEGTIVSGVPEPGSLFLMGGAALAMLGWRKARRS